MQEARNSRITKRNPDKSVFAERGVRLLGWFLRSDVPRLYFPDFSTKPVSSPFEGQVSLFSQIFLVCENKRPGFPTLQDEGFQMPFTTYVQ